MIQSLNNRIWGRLQQNLLPTSNMFSCKMSERETQMPITPQDFVSKWKRVTAREKQTYQEHFIDLCHLAGHQTPNDYDPTGKRFAFELGAAKTSGGQGWGKRTLTNLYNARPTWLDLAHKRLDHAVFAAYGWKNDLSEEEILEKLLALNFERGK